MINKTNLDKIILVILFTVIFSFSNIRTVSIISQALFSLYVFYKMYKRKIKTPSVYLLWFFQFLVFGLISTLFSANAEISFKVILNIASKYLLYFSLYNYMIHFCSSELTSIHESIIIASLVLIGRLFISTPISSWTTERLGATIGVNPNLIGLIFTLAVISSYIIYNYTTKKTYLIFLCIFVMITVLTGSRKAFISIFISLCMLMFVFSENRFELIAKSLIIIITFVFIYYVLQNNEVLYELLGKRLIGLNFVSNKQNASTETRLNMINTSFNLFRHKPIFGYGFGNFALISGFGSYSHNNYTEILVSTGILGFFSYYLIYMYLFFKSFLNYKKNRNYLLVMSYVILLLFLDIAMVSYLTIVSQIILILALSTCYHADLTLKERFKNE